MTRYLANGASLLTRLNSGSDIGPFPRINFIEGTGVTITVVSDPTDGEADVTISATGSLSGSGTSGKMTRWTGSTTLGNAILSDDASVITGTATATNALLLNLNGIASQTVPLLRLSAAVSHAGATVDIRAPEQNLWISNYDGTIGGIIGRNVSTGGMILQNAVGDFYIQSGGSSGDILMFTSQSGKTIRLQPAGNATLFEPGTYNGQSVGIKTLTELTTIAAAATTDTTIQIPADGVVLAVSTRVTVVIPTAATYDVGVAGATTRYGTGFSTAANTTSDGTNDAARYYSAAVSVRITPNATPANNSGRLRVTIFYYEVTPATS